ncbi:hypothetical protein [Elizabethkingia ursingii]|uniref:hypothetical protein n=1 Tax=Elizabethkingia ursingii TaxID=1756150 RepID=UPI000750EBA7|nr:hypothetical protein [Elizabethkingia ursingii]KUY29800.1 prevent-host-death protein [Elizabethkingia ursingii]
MNYKLELNMQESDPNLVFNNIIFDSFKVNIVERHIRSTRSVLKFHHVLFKVRTLDNDIIKTKKGNMRVIIKGNELKAYKRLVKILKSDGYKNKLASRKYTNDNYVNFILSLVISNYKLD